MPWHTYVQHVSAVFNGGQLKEGLAVAAFSVSEQVVVAVHSWGESSLGHRNRHVTPKQQQLVSNLHNKVSAVGTSAESHRGWTNSKRLPAKTEIQQKQGPLSDVVKANRTQVPLKAWSLPFVRNFHLSVFLLDCCTEAQKRALDRVTHFLCVKPKKHWGTKERFQVPGATSWCGSNFWKNAHKVFCAPRLSDKWSLSHLLLLNTHSGVEATRYRYYGQPCADPPTIS